MMLGSTAPQMCIFCSRFVQPNVRLFVSSSPFLQLLTPRMSLFVLRKKNKEIERLLRPFPGSPLPLSITRRAWDLTAFPVRFFYFSFSMPPPPSGYTRCSLRFVCLRMYRGSLFFFQVIPPPTYLSPFPCGVER